MKRLTAFCTVSLVVLSAPAPRVRAERKLAAPLLAATVSPDLFHAPAEKGRTRESYIAHGKTAMVATAHPLATAAAVQILKDGGNAVDAAVAASFAIGVVRPQSTGIGGGGFLLSYTAKAHQVEVVDFRERAPKGATRDMFLDAKGEPAAYRHGNVTLPEASVNGPLAVGIPGVVAGLVETQGKRGRLPLAKVMAPAIALARDGFPVYPDLADAIVERREMLAAFPASAAIYLPGGKPLAAGERLVQKDLAATLESIATHGEKDFYAGVVARQIADAVQSAGGILTREDLANYKVLHRQPVTGAYRGHRIVSMPPPSSGGVHVIEILNMLAGDDVGALGFGTTQGVHLLATAMQRAFADRAAYLGDPAFVKVPTRGLLSPEYARERRAAFDLARATPAAKVRGGDPIRFEHPSTSHLSVIDAEGNAVSTTQTVNFTFGSCLVAAGTGVLLNDEMDDFAIKPGVANVFGLVGSDANAVAAGKTMLSSMSPTLVFDKAGRLELALGSPGGPRIISATLQTIINVIDHRMPLADAVHAGRIHQQWLPDELRLEDTAAPASVRAALEKMGHKLHMVQHIGDVQAVGYEPDGTLVGVSDVRSTGAPGGF
jgi:gamma-glutamyltranspeptidase/glutathione hydrolase